MFSDAEILKARSRFKMILVQVKNANDPWELDQLQAAFKAVEEWITAIKRKEAFASVWSANDDP